MIKNNNSGYSVLLAILLVGFMLILTTGVFGLVLTENKDTKRFENYYKSFAGAEGSVELAMLRAKKYNYSHSHQIQNNINDLSVILSKNYLDKSRFHKTKDVLIYYELDATTSKILQKNLPRYEFNIIPLFFYDNAGVYKKVKNITISGLNTDVVWNIVGENSGISGVGNFTNETEGNYKTISGLYISFTTKKVGDFLRDSEKNYLILHNLGNIDINYTLESLNPGEYFTKEANYIIGTGEIGGYKQNLRVKIDTSKFLNLLKYSIFSD